MCGPVNVITDEKQVLQKDEDKSKLRSCVRERKNIYSVSQKSSPLKLFAVFSLLVNLYKLSWLSPKHIPMCVPILVHLSEYLREMYHFYQCDPSNFKN